jgi:hypothetical protein
MFHIILHSSFRSNIIPMGVGLTAHPLWIWDCTIPKVPIHRSLWDSGLWWEIANKLPGVRDRGIRLCHFSGHMSGPRAYPALPPYPHHEPPHHFFILTDWLTFLSSSVRPDIFKNPSTKPKVRVKWIISISSPCFPSPAHPLLWFPGESQSFHYIANLVLSFLLSPSALWALHHFRLHLDKLHLNLLKFNNLKPLDGSQWVNANTHTL